MRLLGFSLLLVLAFRAFAGSTAAVFAIVVTVQPSGVFTLASKPLEVNVSKEDIDRGYVELPTSSVLNVNVGHVHPIVVAELAPGEGRLKSIAMQSEPTMLAMTGMLERLPSTGIGKPTGDSADFVSAKIRELGTAGAGSSSGPAAGTGRISAAPAMGASESLLSYRLNFSDWMRPGRYTVPIIVDIKL